VTRVALPATARFLVSARADRAVPEVVDNDCASLRPIPKAALQSTVVVAGSADPHAARVGDIVTATGATHAPR
jgi:hypothetical protein